jgi:hypothetical protein
MDSNWLDETMPGDRISFGDIIDSEAVAIGRYAVAVKTTGDVSIYKGPAYPRLDYRSEVAHLIDFYTQTFVGREDERERLASFAGQESPGYLLVEAPPGYGKSALMAHLVQRHESGQWGEGPMPELICFFVRQEGGWNTPVAFLQAINSQLLDLLRRPGGVPADLSALQGQFSELWSQALDAVSGDKPLLVLVDGLDEMASGEVTIAHLLPANLTPYVHVVVFSRPNPEPLGQVDLTHPFKKAGVLRLHTFGDAEVGALLREYGTPEGVATDLASRVLAMTKGEPLFARFVCQEVAVEGERALARLEQAPPTDVEAYFRQQFRQLDRLAEGEHTWDILGLLLVALGGMTIDEMAEALGLGRRQARKAVEPIMRFLLGKTRIELMHLQLRKVVAGEFSTDEQAAYRQRLLDWCQRYETQGWPDETPDYVLAYYASHLVEARQIDDLFALVESQEWTAAKYVDTPWAGSLVQDLQLASATTVGKDVEDWARSMGYQLRRALIEELMSRVPTEVVLFLAKLGHVKQAMGLARRHWSRFHVVRQVARIIAPTHPDQAVTLLVELAHLADDKGGLNQCEARLAAAQEILRLVPSSRDIALSLMNEARGLEHTIPEADLMVYRISWDLPTHALSGELEASVEATGDLSPFYRAQALRYISLALPQDHPDKQQLAEQALSTLEALEQTPEVVREKMRAIVTLIPLVDDDRQDELLGLLESAGDYLQSVRAPVQYNRVQCRAVESAAKINLDWAKRMLLESDWKGATEAWSEVVLEIAKVDIDEALQLLKRRFANYAFRSKVLVDIIKMVAFEDIDKAEALIGKYAEELKNDMPEARLALAEGYLAQGDTRKAREIFDKQVLVIGDEGLVHAREDLQLAILDRAGVFLLVEVARDRLMQFPVCPRCHQRKEQEAKELLASIAAHQGRTDFLAEHHFGLKAQLAAAEKLANQVGPEAAREYLASQHIDEGPKGARKTYANIAAIEAQSNPAKLEVFLDHYDDSKQLHHFCEYTIAFPEALCKLVRNNGIEAKEAKAIIERIYSLIVDWECPDKDKPIPHDFFGGRCTCYSKRDRVLAHLVGIMARLDLERAEQMVDALPSQSVKVYALMQILNHTQAEEALVRRIIEVSSEGIQNPWERALRYYDLALSLPVEMDTLSRHLIELAEPLLDEEPVRVENEYGIRTRTGASQAQLRTRKARALVKLVSNVERFADVTENGQIIEGLGSLDEKLWALDVLTGPAMDWSEEDRLALLWSIFEIAADKRLRDVQAFIAFSIPLVHSIGGEEAFWRLYRYIEWAYEQVP